jgi:hypothetical protein
MDYESRQLPVRPTHLLGGMAVVFLESFKHVRQTTVLIPSAEGDVVAIVGKGASDLPEHLAGLPSQEICAKAELSLGANTFSANATIYSGNNLPSEIPSPRS